MKEQVFRMKTRVIQGENTIQQVPNLLSEFGSEKVLIVTDPGIKKAGLLKRLENILEEKDVNYKVFDEVIPNPPTHIIKKGSKLISEENIDLIIGLGGGSSLDVAKGINIINTNAGIIEDYEGREKVEEETLPFIAIPTTCGTGSEVSWSGVFTGEDDFKFAVLSEQIIPEVAIIDPTLMALLPPDLIAATGMDALTHALEAYVSANAQSFTDSLAIYAIKLISDNLRKAVHYQNNLENIANMAVASTMAGASFSSAGVGLVHAMAHPLGGMFDLPHGIANSILLPYVMKFNLVAAPEKFAKIAEVMGEDVEGLNEMGAAKKALEAVSKLSEDVGIPKSLKEVDIELTEIDKLATDTMRSGNVYSNPRKSTEREIKMLYKKAYEGNL